MEKSIELSQRLAALSVAMGEIEKALEKVGGRITGQASYENVRGLMKFSVNLIFDTNLLCEYAAQSLQRDLDNPA